MTQDSFISHIQISNQSDELKDDCYTPKQRCYFYNVINWFLRSLSIRNKTDMKSTFINTVFVETTYDDFWASGLDKEATIHTRASAWPGTNKLGIIMSEIAGRLRRSPGRSHSASGPKTRTASKDKSKTQQLQISEMIQDICKTQNSGGSVTKKTSTTSQVRDSHARTAEG